MSTPTRTLVLTSLFAAAAVPAVGQTHHVTPPEKVTRAVAVYEWTGDLAKPTASRLVPVSLFINGRFEDAGLYLAHPVPFAVEPGDIYSVEQAGEHKGDLLIEHARDLTTGRLLADVDPLSAWYGYGRFSPLAPPKPSTLKPSAHPSVLVSSSDSGHPHLGAKADTPADTPAASRDSSPPASTPSSAKTGDDPDRPTLGRRTGSASDSDDTATPKDSTRNTDKDPERPSLRKRSAENTGKKSPPTAGVTGPERSLNDDPDRPVIRHGNTAAQEDAAELKTTPAGLHQVAAVSDSKVRDEHVFTREWDTPAERADVLSRMEALARIEAAAYLTQNHLTPGPLPPAKTPSPTPTATTAPTSLPADSSAPTLRRTPNGVLTTTAVPTGAPAPAAAGASGPDPRTRAGASVRTGAKSRTAASRAAKPAPAAPLFLTAEQLVSYTLSYGGLPTFVYTAEVPVTGGGTVYVTLLAQRLPSGEFQTALRSTTDSTHLDRTPWMRPIDAVDPDASHRASLLFELRAQKTRQFALYRLLSAQAEQQFLSQPIP